MTEDSKICRLCLGKSACISIFSTTTTSTLTPEDTSGETSEDYNMLYSDQIARCTHLVITQNDGLPTTMCTTCEAELTVSYHFLMKCQASDAALRQLYSGSLFPDMQFNIKHENPDLEDMKEEYLSTFSDEDIDTKVKMDSEEDQKIHQSCTVQTQKKKRGRPRKDPSQLVKYIPKSNQYKKKQSIPCKTCGLLVYSRSAMEIHLRVHSNSKPFMCNECPASFKAKGTLKRHIESRHKPRDRKFVCETCGVGFFRKSDIIIHMRRHTGETPHSCPFCPKRFIQIGSLIRHKRIHTGDKPYACNICSKKFADKSMVQKHMVVHSDERKFSCHLCGKPIKSKTSLTNHLRLHSNEKTYICSFCGATFATKGNLKLHTVRVHSERSGQCSLCNKTFSDVAQHMNKHTGNLPYKCTNCPRAFNSVRSLSNHLKFKHENVGKYKCLEEDCDRSFPAPSMLQFHILKHHTNQTPFICEHCSRGFFRSSDLSRHLRVSHLQIGDSLERRHLTVIRFDNTK